MRADDDGALWQVAVGCFRHSAAALCDCYSRQKLLVGYRVVDSRVPKFSLTLF
jgi:hypothetical protein